MARTTHKISFLCVVLYCIIQRSRSLCGLFFVLEKLPQCALKVSMAFGYLLNVIAGFIIYRLVFF